ncbi:MAG: phytanoyl-CoA dioxygenase family protein [Chloroflexi bacterium]|nr:phytanoyl-CoA dioxygenase family protein [Chloroflexota bacterium]MCY4247205.1 phytanoyl-CoA dioxygenase family protein [Chloroflexota bacterium]
MQVDVQAFQERGCVAVSGLFSDDEVARYRQHFMDMRQNGSYPGDFAGVDATSDDPLKRYPRLIHMHRWDELSLRWLLDDRLAEVFARLLGKLPLAVQTMLYFKPAGARGQALHQDQYYLRVQPGTCIAAWMALDDCDEENGCLQIVSGSHNMPLLCPTEADVNQSFTDVTVPLSADMRTEPVPLRAGDVFFFNGQLIHGSFPNRSQTRFRRALIGHYIDGDALQVAKYYHPVLRFAGGTADLAVSEGGGKCGVWVDQNGREVLEMTGALHQLA